MYVKMFSNKKGGSKASIKYLLNQREAQGTARVLVGNPQITESIINTIERKQKVTVGALSFEESNPLSEEQKYKMIEDFEKTLFPGMDKEQYNILWVEHTDKGRLELNFVVPKVELTTQKALQPYYHKRDFSRIDMFEDIQNIKYNLTSKKDPAKQRTLQGSYKEINLVKDYKELDQTIFELVKDQQIQNRDQMIELLKSNNIQVTRASKDSMSVKLPDSKKARKLKGGIYNEQFTSLERLEAISTETDRRIKEFQQRDTSRELEQTQRKLDRFNEQKARELKDQYNGKTRETIKSPELQTQQSISRDARESKLEQTTNNQLNSNYKSSDRDSRNDISKTLSHTDREQQLDSTKGTKIPRGEREIYPDREEQPEPIRGTKQDNEIPKDRRVEDDIIGTATLRRIRAERKEQQKAYAEARRSRIEVHKSIGDRSKQLRDQYGEASKGTRTTVAEIQREHEQVVQKSTDHIESVERAKPTLSRYARFKERVSDYISTARSYINDKYQDFKSRYEKNFFARQDDLEQQFNRVDKNTRNGYEKSFGDLKAVSSTFETAAQRDIQQEQKHEAEQQQQRSRSRSYGLVPLNHF